MTSLDVKATMKKKQPAFIRHEGKKRKRLNTAWRKPKGLHNKVGDNRRGYGIKLKSGYQTPKAVRGCTLAGLLPVRVVHVADLDALDAKTHCIVVAHVGGKRRIDIIEAAHKKNFTLLNATDATVKTLKERFAKQTAAKKVRVAEKEKKEKELEKKSKEKLEEKLEKAPARKEETKTKDEKKSEAATPAKKETPKGEKPPEVKTSAKTAKKEPKKETPKAAPTKPATPKK